MRTTDPRHPLPSGMRVLQVPGIPADVEVRASSRRRRSVAAFREQGRTIVVVPSRMPRSEIASYVRDLVGRLDARERRVRRSDEDLVARAGRLSAQFLGGAATPRSVRWVDNQHSRWGSCTPADASIRLSSRLRTMPAHVVDYVLLHELAHLLVPGHGPDFHAHLQGFPRLAEAQAFLAGVDHATGQGWSGDVDDVAADADAAGAAGAEHGGGADVDLTDPVEPHPVEPHPVEPPVGMLW
jgi:predicted metal-dependent hydrolase